MATAPPATAAERSSATRVRRESLCMCALPYNEPRFNASLSAIKTRLSGGRRPAIGEQPPELRLHVPPVRQRLVRCERRLAGSICRSSGRAPDGPDHHVLRRVLRGDELDHLGPVTEDLERRGAERIREHVGEAAAQETVPQDRLRPVLVGFELTGELTMAARGEDDRVRAE